MKQLPFFPAFRVRGTSKVYFTLCEFKNAPCTMHGHIGQVAHIEFD
jgi:hypothetical protein